MVRVRKSGSVSRRPFLIVLEQTPFEGWNVTGILGGSDGTMRAFNYYEGCCQPPTPQLEAGLCESPSAKAKNSWPYGVGCANEDERGFVPMPELWLRERPLPPDLSSGLRAISGDAIDCGFELAYASNPHLYSAPRLTQAFACARSATTSGRGFWILVPSGRFESPIVHGLVGRASGTVSEFLYDTAPCSGPGCPRAFEPRDCPQPRVVRGKDGGGDFACSSPATVRTPPSPRRPGP